MLGNGRRVIIHFLTAKWRCIFGWRKLEYRKENPPSVASKRFKLKTMHQCNSANNYTTVMLTQYFLEEIPMQQSEILKKVLKSS